MYVAGVLDKDVNDLVVTAEKYVDETLVPLFIDGVIDQDVIEDYKRSCWQQGATEPCCSFLFLACVHCLREQCESQSMPSEMPVCETPLSVRLRLCHMTSFVNVGLNMP